MKILKKYTTPKLIILDIFNSIGACNDGSSDSNCADGYKATSNGANSCTTGDQATGHCVPGTFAGQQCRDGGGN